MTMGSTIMPLSDFLHLLHFLGLLLYPKFLWIMPSPPSWAMQMAVFASVTVSMAALIRGILSFIARVNRSIPPPRKAGPR